MVARGIPRLKFAERLRSVGLEPPSEQLSLGLWVHTEEGEVGCVCTRGRLVFAWADQRFELPVEDEVLEDLLVTALVSEPEQREGPAAMALLGGTSVEGSTQTGRLRQAAHGVWRTLLEHGEMPPRIERLHGDFQPPEPPWRTTGFRRIRAFAALDQLPPLHSGGWVIDARNVQRISEPTFEALRRLPALGDTWIGEGVPRPCFDEDNFEMSRLRSLRWDAWTRLQPMLEPRFAERAKDVLYRGLPLADLDRWTSSWPKAQVPKEALFLTPAPCFSPPPPPWIAYNAKGLWAASGSSVRAAHKC